jgi:hypothetical protein
MIYAMTYLDLKKDGLLVVTAPPPLLGKSRMPCSAF